MERQISNVDKLGGLLVHGTSCLLITNFAMAFTLSKNMKKFLRIGLAILCTAVGILAGVVFVHAGLGLIGALLIDPANVLSWGRTGVPLIAGVFLYLSVRGLKTVERLKGQQTDDGP